MKKLLFIISVFLLIAKVNFAQEPVVFYDGADGPWFEWSGFWGGSLPVVGTDTCKFGFDESHAQGKKSIKWVMDDTDNGYGWAWWSDWNKFNYKDLFDGGYLSIWIRIPAAVDTVILEFKTDNDKRMLYYLTSTTATFDDAWHQYKIPFKDWITPPKGYTQKIDSTNVTNFGIYTNKGVKGATVYIGEVSANPMDPVVFFDGQTDPNTQYTFYFWGSTYGIGSEIVPNAGYRFGTSAIKWMQDIGWGSCGVGWFFYATMDFTPRINKDSIKFKIMTPSPADSLILEINSDKDHAVQYSFKPEATTDWQLYSIPIKDFKVPADKQAPDFTQIKEFGIFTNHPTDGLIVYIADVWTGNPVFEIDTTAPEAPKNVRADYASDKYNYNIVKWDDVPGEASELYNVYYSEKPITDLTADNVILLAKNIGEGSTGVNHYFFCANKDQARTYYYAVTCKDKAGNVSVAGLSPAISNAAKGVPVINYGAPTNFSLDGSVSEWTANNIKPFLLNKSHSIVVDPGLFTDDADCTAKIYLAVDDNNLYVAADVTDDVVDFATTGELNKHDIIFLHLGLYNLVGKMHDGSTTLTMRDKEPDYMIYMYGTQITKRVVGDVWDADHWKTMFNDGSEYYSVTNFVPTQYTMEAKIPLDSLMFEGDARFHPAKGMRIPIEILVSDKDNGVDVDGSLSSSPNYNGWEWSDPSSWMETWIGDSTTVTAVKNVDLIPNKYSLEQNYPNPFNPSTVINYSLEKSGVVKLRVFDMLGREVATLVNEMQSAGSHSVRFETKNVKLASGLYIYQIESGNFIKAHKMLLLK